MFGPDEELNMDFEEEANTAFVEEEVRKAVFVIESLGSFVRTEELGWFRYEKAPREFVDLMRSLTPASRGGSGKGVQVESRWEKLVDEIVGDAEDGIESLERMRAKLNELFVESENRANSPA